MRNYFDSVTISLTLNLQPYSPYSPYISKLRNACKTDEDDEDVTMVPDGQVGNGKLGGEDGIEALGIMLMLKVIDVDNDNSCLYDL